MGRVHSREMRRETRSSLLPLAAFLALLSAGAAPAQMPYAPFGARQIALGGAAVALGNDPAGFVNNPALLLPDLATSAISLGVVSTSAGDFYPLVKGVSGNDPVELAKPGSVNADAVRSNLNALAAPGVGALGQRPMGIAAALNGWGITVVSWESTGAFVKPDLVHVQPGLDPSTSFAANGSLAAFRALTLEDYAVSRAFPFLDGGLVLGLTGHYLRGTTGIKEEDLFTTGTPRLDSYVRRGAGGGVDRTRSRFSWDAGLLVNLGVFKIGAVMNGINRPQFPYDEEGAPLPERDRTVTVGRQTRAGFSLALARGALTVAGDLDLEKNETLVDGLASRVAGGGLEWLIGAFAVRGGLSVDLEAPGRPAVYSSGLGYRTGKFRIDVSGTYRSNDGAVGGVLTARTGI